MFSEDRRRYPRLKAGVRVLYEGLRPSPTERQYLSGVAEDLSLSGMFLSSEHPFPPGTLLTLEFRTPDMSPEELPVCARALVRWRSRWGACRGMGISFVELEGIGRQRIQSWLDRVLSQEPGPLLRLPFLPITFAFGRNLDSEQPVHRAQTRGNDSTSRS